MCGRSVPAPPPARRRRSAPIRPSSPRRQPQPTADASVAPRSQSRNRPRPPSRVRFRPDPPTLSGLGQTPGAGDDGRYCLAIGAIPDIDLNDGRTIPQLGFGVFQIPPDETAQAVRSALEVGYRHIDTAEMYGNEREVGDALRASGLERGEVFVTSKLNNPEHRPDDARTAFDRTLADLGSDYVDLFLIHWPLPTRYDGDYVSTWKTLEEFHGDGRARSIGLSNFQVAHLERILAEGDVPPAVNQIELHPYLLNEEVRSFGEAREIRTEAWSPLAKGQVADDPTITEIAGRLGRTPAQVVLRWHIQRGSIVFPKSTHPERMRENFDLFDFEVPPEDMERLTALDRGEAGRTGPDPDTFDWVG